jgi:hypothetical protein
LHHPGTSAIVKSIAASFAVPTLARLNAAASAPSVKPLLSLSSLCSVCQAAAPSVMPLLSLSSPCSVCQATAQSVMPLLSLSSHCSVCHAAAKFASMKRPSLSPLHHLPSGQRTIYTPPPPSYYGADLTNRMHPPPALQPTHPADAALKPYITPSPSAASRHPLGC